MTPEDQEKKQPEILVSHIRIRNYRGIENLDIDIPPGGVVFAGRNAAGKTSAIMALHAVLEAQGIGPESIRFDAPKAEVLVDMQALLARRTINRRSTSLDALARDGSPLPRAKDQVADLMGERRLDPLALFLASPKEQRQIILSATDVPVTAEDFNRWCEGEQAWALTGNGQEDLARIRQMYVEQRTAKGNEKKKANDDLAAADTEVRQAQMALETLGRTGAQPAVQAVEANKQSIERDLAVLRERRSQTAERAESAKGVLAKVESKRAQARELMSQDKAIPPNAEDLEQAVARANQALEILEKARQAHLEACEVVDNLREKQHKADEAAQNAQKLEAEALELEQSVAAMQVSDSSVEAISREIDQAEQARGAAALDIQAAKAYATLQVAKAKAQTLSQAASAADAAHEKLSRIVSTLSKEAPSELSRRANLIPDLEITPTAITYQGKPIGQLSSAEQMSLAVMVAKRIQGDKAKILTVDGLERLDPEQQPKFLRMALEGGWQVFGTRVQAGDLAIVDCYELAHSAG